MHNIPRAYKHINISTFLLLTILLPNSTSPYSTPQHNPPSMPLSTSSRSSHTTYSSSCFSLLLIHPDPLKPLTLRPLPPTPPSSPKPCPTGHTSTYTTPLEQQCTDCGRFYLHARVCCSCNGTFCDGCRVRAYQREY